MNDTSEKKLPQEDFYFWNCDRLPCMNSSMLWSTIHSLNTLICIQVGLINNVRNQLIRNYQLNKVFRFYWIKSSNITDRPRILREGNSFLAASSFHASSFHSDSCVWSPAGPCRCASRVRPLPRSCVLPVNNYMNNAFNKQNRHTYIQMFIHTHTHTHTHTHIYINHAHTCTYMHIHLWVHSGHIYIYIYHYMNMHTILHQICTRKRHFFAHFLICLTSIDWHIGTKNETNFSMKCSKYRHLNYQCPHVNRPVHFVFVQIDGLSSVYPRY